MPKEQYTWFFSEAIEIEEKISDRSNWWFLAILCALSGASWWTLSTLA